MIEILLNNYDLLNENHAGYYGKDLPATLKQDKIIFEDIVRAYNLDGNQSESSSPEA